jgi:hypothetical protein
MPLPWCPASSASAAASGVPYQAYWARVKISQPSRWGRMTAGAARFQTETPARGAQLLFGAGAGHRASASGWGGSTSVSRLKARSRRSAGDRFA